MNVAAGRTAAGTYVVLASGWSPVLEPGDESRSTPPEDGVLRALVCRSEDHGHRWNREGTFVLPDESAPAPIPFGDVVEGDAGLLAASAYHRYRPGRRIAYFYVSTDRGASWRLRAGIGADDCSETALLHLGSGEWLAACRTLRDAHLRLFRSRDDGLTWRDEGPLTLPRQHPAHLLRLADGRILLVYGMRNQGLYGIGARLSPDDGATWGPPRLLVDLDDATDGGYPSSVQMPDGTIVTAYYANRVACHRRYHMGVLRWSPRSSAWYPIKLSSGGEFYAIRTRARSSALEAVQPPWATRRHQFDGVLRGRTGSSPEGVTRIRCARARVWKVSQYT